MWWSVLLAAATSGGTAKDLGCDWAKGEPSQKECLGQVEVENLFGRTPAMKYESLQQMKEVMRAYVVCDETDALAARYGLSTEGLKIHTPSGTTVSCKVK